MRGMEARQSVTRNDQIKGRTYGAAFVAANASCVPRARALEITKTPYSISEFAQAVMLALPVLACKC
jgi:hypothetical protein